ncbi:MAG: ATP-dependent helicase [Terriglobales bacterium]
MGFAPDPQQKKAIEHVHGPMLVVAGAGTGKTTVLVERVVNLIEKQHARPDEVLAVTFTINAAAELRERVAAKVGPLWANTIQASTFHAYCHNLLTGARQSFTPVTKEDLYVLLRRELKNLGLKYYIRAAKPGQFLTALLALFERCDDELVTPERYREYVEELKVGKHPLPRVLTSKNCDDLQREEVIERCEEIAHVFQRANEMLAERNLGTFGHQISRAVRLLAENPKILAEERQRARFILIDEFQDSNVAQIKLAKLLASDEQNVFAVGDPDQAIYRFRGATAGAFDHFEKQFANTQHVTLDQNRRSLGPILRCAFRVISQNPVSGQLERKPLVSARENNPTLPKEGRMGHPEKNAENNPTQPKEGCMGHPLELVYTPGQFSNETEAAEIADAIEKLHSPHLPKEGRYGAPCLGHETREGWKRCEWRDIAILYRQHGHRELLARELSRRGIPVLVRGVNVLDTPEVRDAMAVMRAISNVGDNAAIFRASALPQFGIDPGELRAALNAAGREAKLVCVLQKVKGGSALLDALAKARRLTSDAGNTAAAALAVGIKQFELPRNEAVQALVKFISDWAAKPITSHPSTEAFLEYLEYFTEIGGKICLPEPEDAVNAVQFMTAHAAKGLEFPHVFVIRGTTGSFPSNYKEDLFEFPDALRDSLTTTSGDAKELHNQEERRLFYVAMTRARDTLAIYAKRSRSRKTPVAPLYNEATPPGFIRDMVSNQCVPVDCVPRLAEFRPEIQAAAEEVQAFSPVAEWMLLEPARDMEKISLSATRIETYDQCPLRFKIETDWNIPGESAPALHFGNAVHTALKAYNDAVQAGRPLKIEDFLKVFTTQMEISPFDDAHQKQLYLEQGLRQLEDFYYLRNIESVPHVLATEKVFSLIVGGVKVVGRIDFAARTPKGGVAIVDYKTGRAKDEEEAERSLQFSIYALAVQQEWNELPERIAFYNLETNAPAETSRTADQLTDTRAKIQEVAQAIQAGKFRPRTGFHCNWCGYRELCPVQEEPLYKIEAAMPAKAN